MATVAAPWDVGEIKAAIARLRPVPRRAGQRFGGVTIGDNVRMRAAEFATVLHAEYGQYVARPEVTATGDGGIAFRWRRIASESAEPVDVELVFVHGETEYAITPAGSPDTFIDEGSTDRVDTLLHEVVKRHLLT
jgi:hypothetical protein